MMAPSPLRKKLEATIVSVFPAASLTDAASLKKAGYRRVLLSKENRIRSVLGVYAVL